MQTLKYTKTILEDDETVEFYEIKEGDTIFLIPESEYTILLIYALQYITFYQLKFL